MAQLPVLEARWLPAAQQPPATRDARAADPSADGRRSAAIFGRCRYDMPPSNCHRRVTYRLVAAAAAIPCFSSCLRLVGHCGPLTLTAYNSTTVQPRLKIRQAQNTPGRTTSPVARTVLAITMSPSPHSLFGTRSSVSTPRPIWERSIVMNMYVCLSVCLSVHDYIFGTARRPIFAKFLCMLSFTAVARSSSGGVVIRYVLPVLWITSHLLTSRGCSTTSPS